MISDRPAKYRSKQSVLQIWGRKGRDIQQNAKTSATGVSFYWLKEGKRHCYKLCTKTRS